MARNEQETQEGRTHYGDDDMMLGPGSYGLRVYFIDDGEHFHYVAHSAWEALRVHCVDHESEAGTHPGEDVTVTLVPPDEVLIIGQEDTPAIGEFPPTFTFEMGDDTGKPMSLTATAAEWAWHERRGVAIRGAAQISASVW